MANSEIRRARREESASLATMEARASSYPWTEGQYADSIANHQTWVLDIDETAVGCLVFSRIIDEVELLNIVVDPVFQGRGLGRKLMNFLIETNASQAEKIFLEVRTSNQPAITLYETVGFNRVGNRKNYYPSPNGREDALIMVYDYESQSQ
ncbi:MAG: ribosomal protein S18-alanine N-acetyltransferase [Porticoccaceae bacterium]|nr:ribosomal protein S18-alanine N-acetyltransferase [Porticoccaceae bacterium]